MSYQGEAALQGTLMLTAVCSLLSVMSRRIPPGTALALHKLVYIRFLIPGLFIAGLSLPAGIWSSGIAGEVSRGTQAYSVTASSETAGYPAHSLVLPWFEIWLGGASLVAAVCVAAAWRQNRRFKACALVDAGPLWSLLQECRRELGFRREVKMRRVPGLHSAALHGILRPELLVPAGWNQKLNGEEWRHVILHELCHLRRRDNLWNLVCTAALVLNWYNPLLWAFRKATSRLQEEACDAEVLRHVADPATYARTLIRAVEFPGQENPGRPSIGMAYLTHTDNQIARRVLMIRDYKKQGRLGTLSGIALVAMAAGIGWQSAAAEEKQAEGNKIVKPAKPQIAIQAKIKFKGDLIAFPQVVTQEDREATITIGRELDGITLSVRPESIDRVTKICKMNAVVTLPNKQKTSLSFTAKCDEAIKILGDNWEFELISKTVPRS